MFTHLNDEHIAGQTMLVDDPVRIAWWLKAASKVRSSSSRLVRHNRRSGGQPVLGARAISRLRKPLTGASFSLRGRPSGLVKNSPPQRAFCNRRAAAPLCRPERT